MLLCVDVLIASRALELTETLSLALEAQGAIVVGVEDLDEAADRLADGFRPDAVVIDGALGCAGSLVAAIHRVPGLSCIPVIAATPSRADLVCDVMVRRSDLGELVNVLERLCGTAETPVRLGVSP